ncbi:hypothetical protein PIB30_094185 [Stylosanthes scabra]|uniref:Uncharacterized protein n=1 Tax=Stylosanthes scabra TaxID=79078 RepID=A0ABU6ZU05_9FABA|nr:hypothetical protein [Stylosanthes scabra]
MIKLVRVKFIIIFKEVTGDPSSKRGTKSLAFNNGGGWTRTRRRRRECPRQRTATARRGGDIPVTAVTATDEKRRKGRKQNDIPVTAVTGTDGEGSDGSRLARTEVVERHWSRRSQALTVVTCEKERACEDNDLHHNERRRLGFSFSGSWVQQVLRLRFNEG